MPLDRDLLDAVRDLDQHDLRRLLILARAQLEREGVIGSGGPGQGAASQADDQVRQSKAAPPAPTAPTGTPTGGKRVAAEAAT